MTVEALGLYDPYTHTTWDDPYPVYRQLRDDYPVYRNDARDCWVVSRYEDVDAISRNVQTFSCLGGVDLDLPEFYLGPGDMLAVDPPVHTRLRRVVREFLTPKAVEGLEPMIRTQVRAAIDRMISRGEGDVAVEIAFPLPMNTILTLMGLPEEDWPQLQVWLDATAFRTPGTPDRPIECDEAHDALASYVATLVEKRRSSPRDDVVTAIARAIDEGSMSVDEIRGMSLLLLTAGWETTAALIGNALYLLASNPNQRSLLVDGQASASGVVEEVLRVESPVQYLHRTTTERAVVRDVAIPAGAKVLLLYGAANRDPRRWEDAEAFDVLRPLQRHVAFGRGIHLCLGAPLARLECRIVLEEFVARAPDYSISGATKRIEAHVLRGFHRLPIGFEGPRASTNRAP